ncbi:MAG: hypothetical protein EOP24_36955 [Hyphomicrobiales bacterium]|nr:MAG: hypothetical protein EOP24_36955 [Hyphomicrobiales bacterium]
MAKPRYEDLQIAHLLVCQQQDRSYWLAQPVPSAPIGRVFLEPLRQLSTFLLPLSLIAWCAYQYGFYTITTTLPAAFLLGFLLDRQLCWSIRRKQRRQADIDRGRYEAVGKLSQTLALPPSAITLDMIEAMAREFKVESARRTQLATSRIEAERRAHAQRQAARAHSTSEAGSLSAVTAVAMTGTAPGADTRYWDMDERSSYDHEPLYPAINPGSGLPMAGNDTFGVDVGGHTYGSGF